MKSLCSISFLIGCAGLFVSCATGTITPSSQHPRPETAWQSTPPPMRMEKQSRIKPPQRETTLPNGLKIIVVEHRRRPIVSIRLLLPSGSASDPKDAIGATYFGLKLLGDFYEEKPDGRRISGEKSMRRQFLEEGASMSIGVGVDASIIGIDGYARDTGRYLKQLSKLINKPRQGLYSFSGRKESIISALKDVDLSSDSHFYELLEQAAFGKESVYARPAYGDLETLAELSHEAAATQQGKVLSAKDAVLIVVGNVKAKSVFMTAMKFFGRWRATKPPARAKPKPSKVFRRKHVIIVERKPAEMTALCVARPLNDIKGQDAELDVMATVFGRGMQSRLVQKLRVEHGLSYGATASVVRRRHGRVLYACTRVPKHTTEIGTRLFFDVIKEMNQHAPSVKEVETAKRRRIRALETTQETVFGSLWTLYDAYVRKDYSSAESKIAELRAVDADHVHRLAKRVFQSRRFQVLFSGEALNIRMAIHANRLGQVKTIKAGLMGDVKPKQKREKMHRMNLMRVTQDTTLAD